MFTGLIDRVGRLASFERRGNGASLRIDHVPWPDTVKDGESIAVSGACLTVACHSDNWFVCDLLAESLQRTCLGEKKAGAPLNLERAIKAGDRLGGHIVSGHIDGIGMVSDVRRTGDDYVLQIECAGDLAEATVTKGSVALDGVSLTVSALGANWFEVHIIPHTWSNTAVHALQTGDGVNIETDMLGKYVQRFLGRTAPRPSLTVDDLTKAGFA